MYYNENELKNENCIDKIKQWNILISDIIDYFSDIHNTEISNEHLARVRNHNFVQNLKLSKELCKFGQKTYDLKENQNFIQSENDFEQIEFLENQIELAYSNFNDIYKHQFLKLEKQIEESQSGLNSSNVHQPKEKKNYDFKQKIEKSLLLGEFKLCC